MIQYEFTPEQTAERRTGIGASHAGKIAAGQWYDLWLWFTGRAEDKKIMSDWQRYLRAVTEDAQMNWLELRGGRDANGVLVIPPGQVAERGEMLRCERYPFMRVTLDGLIMPQRVPVNAKHLSKWSGKKDSVREWAIREYTPQLTHEAICLDAPYGYISLIWEGVSDPELIRVDVDPWFAETLIEAERDFWQYVVDDKPTPDAPPLTVPVVDTATLRKIDLAVDNPNWRDEWIALADKFASTEGAFKLHAITRDKMKKLMPDDASEVRYGHMLQKRTKANAIVMTLEKTDDSTAQ